MEPCYGREDRRARDLEQGQAGTVELRLMRTLVAMRLRRRGGARILCYGGGLVERGWLAALLWFGVAVRGGLG